MTAGLKHNPQMSSGSAYINYHLLTRHYKLKEPDSKIVHPNGDTFDLNLMDSIIGKSHIPNHMITYSGVSFDPDEIKNNYGLIHSPAYMSTSTRRFVAGKYAVQHGDNLHHILAINHSSGDKGLYVGSGNDLSIFHDDEMIMPRGEMLRLNGYHDYKHDHRVFRVWDTHRKQK